MRGRDAFLDSAAGLKPIVRGHRLQRQWADGDEICSWYDVDLQTPVTSGAVTMSEWHTVREGKLASGRVVFDAAEIRQRAMDSLGFLGVVPDPRRNAEGGGDREIGQPGAPVRALVISAREDLEVARQVRAVLSPPRQDLGSPGR